MQPIDPKKLDLLDAALPHVAFDGWGPATFDAAVAQTGIDHAHAKTLCPRGAVDLAVLFHQQGDAAMVKALQNNDLTDMRFRDKVATAIRLRLAAVPDKEPVRLGTTLFALPHMAPEGARLIWGTADLIWNTLGDTADDINWYTKRATLSGVYAAVVLFWLGDSSDNGQDSDDFIDRRIDDVMQIEMFKAHIRKSPFFNPLTGPLAQMANAFKPPSKTPDKDLPGIWRD